MGTCACSRHHPGPAPGPAPGPRPGRGYRLHHVLQLRRFVRACARRHRLAAQTRRPPARDEPAIEPEPEDPARRGDAPQQGEAGASEWAVL